MGCWNGTCAITNLPIHYGEEVYTFFLVERPYLDNHCYQNTYYDLFPFHFTGKYDDYGDVEDCSEESKYVIDYLKENVFEFEQGENKYHDIPVKKDAFDLEMLFKADHSKRLYVKNSSRLLVSKKDKLRFTHILVKKTIIDKILNSIGIPYYKNEDYMNTVYAKYMDFENEVPTLRTSASNHKSELLAFRLLVDELDEKWDFLKYIKVKHGWNYATHLAYSNIENEKEFNTIMMQLIMCNLLDYMMDDARRVWIRPSGDGSQNSGTFIQKTLAQITIDEPDYSWDEDLM